MISLLLVRGGDENCTCLRDATRQTCSLQFPRGQQCCVKAGAAFKKQNKQLNAY